MASTGRKIRDNRSGAARTGLSGSPLRIAYLTGHFPQPTHTFFWREIRALRDLGLHVDIVSTRRPVPRGGDDEWARIAAGETTYLWPPCRDALRGLHGAVGGGWMRVFQALRRAQHGTTQLLLRSIPLAAVLSALGEQRQWAHTHVGFTENAAGIAMLANRLTGRPYSVSQGHSIRISGPNQHLKWGHAAFGTAISTYLRDEVEAFLAPECTPRVLLAPRGVDTDRFRRSVPYEPWTGEGVCRLFTCGRVTREKGYLELVEALALLRARGVSCQLRAAGPVPDRREGFPGELQDHARRLGVAEHVKLLGRVTQSEVRRELESAHVAVQAANATYIEGWGNAVAESVAMGVPTVACRTGGIIDTIHHGATGLLAEPGDALSLAECVYAVLQSPGMALQMSNAGPPSIAERFGRLAGARILRDAILDSLGEEAASA